MNLARKYDNTLRRKYSFRAVWLPGTEIKVGDIMMLKNGALVSVGNIGNEAIPFEEESIAEIGPLDIKSTGVAKSISQEGVKVKFDKLDADVSAQLDIAFNTENAYFLKTPKLSGKGMVSARGIARKVAKLANWNFQKYYVVHQVYTAEDFVFLGSASKGNTITFEGSAEAIKNFIATGCTAELNRTGTRDLNIEVSGQAGPVVLRLFRIKKNGALY